MNPRSLSLLAAIAAVAFSATMASAQDWAKARLNNSPRHGEWVEYPAGSKTLKAFMVYPERKEKAPVVIVIHEIFGLTDWVRGVCDQLAENGVIAIAPDMLSGQTFADVDGARKAISALKPEDVITYLDRTVDYIGTKVRASNSSIAVCGFCWGGGQTIQYAIANPNLKAAYSFYGPLPDDPEQLKRISCPVYGFYGEKDQRVNAGIPKAEEIMKAAGKKYEPVIYTGAGHGFMREGEAPDSTDENHAANVKARDDAWARWKTLLQDLDQERD
jgi:carboxymethylenebutenolidase